MASFEQAEEDLWTRPPASEIESAWKDIFTDPLLSLPRLKAEAFSKSGIGLAGTDGGVPLRSLYWRLYYDLLPSPTSVSRFPGSLESRRSAYTALRNRLLIAPDGRFASDCSILPTDRSAPGPSRRTPLALPQLATGPNGGWDPLSLDGGSPWKTWFQHLDLRRVVRQDVDRTFPDMKYFQGEEVRKGLVTGLFLWAVTHPDVGYRQGMHELFAVCYLVVDRDSLLVPETQDESPLSPTANQPGAEDSMLVTLDRRYVEHDAFALFQEIMKSAKPFYEWRAEEGPRIGNAVAPKAPIITRCNELHSSLIRRIDPQLWERLETEGVEAQIWAIRWIRLIFTRELPFPIALRIWDGVFAEDPGLGILDFVVVAMLLLIRNELIEADYSTLLTTLLRYPSPCATYPFVPSLILSQALFLRANINPAAGVQIVMQNQEQLGISAQPPERKEETPSLRGHPGMRGRGGMRGRVPPKAGMQGLAAGLYERAQASGWDKTIMSTVADLRKNIPDSAYSYLPNIPFSPLQSPGSGRELSGSFSSIPTSTSALNRSHFLASPCSTPSAPAVMSRPSVDSLSSVRAIKDAERDMAELRLAMVGMGKAMSEWLGSLPRSDEETPEQAHAWQGLGRVRETLLDAAAVEADELVKEWGWHEGLEALRSGEPTPSPGPSSPKEEADRPPAVSPQLVFDSTHDRTPTAPSFEITPTPPAAVVLASQNLPSPVEGSSRIPLQPFTRDENPIASLPRIPMTAPLSRMAGSRPTSWPAAKSAISADPLRGKAPDGSPAAAVRASQDPLAGMGVGEAKLNGWTAKTGSSGQSGAGEGVDPLLGLGVR